MSRLEIKDLSVSSLEQTARTEHLSAGIAGDQQNLVGIGNGKGLAVGLLLFQLNTAIDAMGNGVSRIDDPKDLSVIRLSPAEMTGCTHQQLEGLGVVCGM